MGKKSGSFFDMQFITSSISTMLVLLLLGMVVFFVLSANNLSKYVRENISFSVLISDDMKEADALKFQKKLNEEPFVKETSYISKEQALKEQSEAMGTDPAEFLGYNPFTASIEIKLNADYANSDSISWIEQKIMQNKKVMEINYPQDLLDAVNSNIRLKISFCRTRSCHQQKTDNNHCHTYGKQYKISFIKGEFLSIHILLLLNVIQRTSFHAQVFVD